MQMAFEDHVQGAGVADYAGTLNMMVFRFEITDSVVSVRYRLKILYQNILSKNVLKKGDG